MEQINNVLNSDAKLDEVDQETCMPRRRRRRLKNTNQGCNSIDIRNLRLELRFKLRLRQGLRTRLGMHSLAAMVKARVKARVKAVQMSFELHPCAMMASYLKEPSR